MVAVVWILPFDGVVLSWLRRNAERVVPAARESAWIFQEQPAGGAGAGCRGQFTDLAEVLSSTLGVVECAWGVAALGRPAQSSLGTIHLAEASRS